jgi:hypothetical protein
MKRECMTNPYYVMKLRVHNSFKDGVYNSVPY